MFNCQESVLRWMQMQNSVFIYNLDQINIKVKSRQKSGHVLTTVCLPGKLAKPKSVGEGKVWQI